MQMTAAEKRIRELVFGSDTEDYDGLLSGERNPEVLFALLGLRSQLLSWLPVKEGDRVLELGSGFGTLTGVFLSRGASVDAVEERPLQAECLKRRFRHRGAFKVYQEIPGPDGTGAYDWIVLAEPSGFSGRSRLNTLLPELAGRLNESGLLLLYLRNRLSAYYLLGGTDSEVRVPFSALSGEAGEHLFTRREAEALAESSGFSVQRCFYPLPDERFPQVICSDEYLPGLTLRDRIIPFYPYGNTLVGSERGFLDTAIREGLLPETAPGFLMALRPAPSRAGKPDPAASSCAGKPDLAASSRAGKPNSAAAALPGPADRTGKLLGAVLSGDREKAHAYRLLFLSDGTVRKEAVYPEGGESLAAMCRNHRALRKRGLATVEEREEEGAVVMPFRREDTLANALLKNHSRERLLGAMERLYREILKSSDQADPAGLSPEEEAAFRSQWGDPALYRETPVLKTGYIDLIPYNCFLTESGEEETFCFFDQEFTVPFCPALYILYRALRYTWMHVPEAEDSLPLSEAYRQFGISRFLPLFAEREDAFVGANRNRELYRSLYLTAYEDEGRNRENRERLLPSRREADGTPGNLTEEALPDLALLHEAQEDLLRELDRICGEQGLTWVAVHGTLLGAARHRGFIPWDHTAEVAMPRGDYEKLKKLMKTACRPPYAFQTPESDPDSFFGGHARFRTSRVLVREAEDGDGARGSGAWISIYPLDYLSDSPKEEKKRFRTIVRLQRLLLARCYPLWAGKLNDARGGRVSLYYLLGKRIPHRVLTSRLERALTSCPETETYTIRARYYPWGRNRNRFPVKDLEELVRLPFGSITVPAPANYRKWLERRYGANYMQLPPEEKRAPKRGLTVRVNPESRKEM